MSERDKFLTESMGECWHVDIVPWTRKSLEYSNGKCSCGLTSYDCMDKNTDFSTWQGFGKLWEWAQEQEWWCEFINRAHHRVAHPQRREHLWVDVIVKPDNLANAVYEFLKDNS